jgi:preprotein translocase subunit SecY
VTGELARRIVFTIGALLVFRLGSFIPLAGTAIQSGPLLYKPVVSVFSLGVVPYLSAAIIVQLISVAWGRLRSLERSGEAGRRKIARYTLILTLVLAAFQAYGVASVA